MPLIKGTIERGIAWGREKFDDIKLGIIAACTENHELIATLLELAAEFGVRVYAEIIVKGVSRSLYQDYFKSIGVLAEVMQGGLESYGYGKVGKGIGLLSNMAPVQRMGLWRTDLLQLLWVQWLEACRRTIWSYCGKNDRLMC